MNVPMGRPQPGNLPGDTNTFVGRRDEVAQVQQLLGRSRLVTLTGVGGVGKTRLALQVAALCRGEYDDGVWLAELSGVRDAVVVPHTVVESLAVVDQSMRRQVDVLAEFVAHKELLLILDSCEHMVDASALLVEVLLNAGPGVQILVTSRQRLEVSGEQVFVVPPLPVPDPSAADPSAADPSAAESSAAELPTPAPVPDAVALFADRASASDPDFRLTDDNRAAVTRLCARLDGLPLAIELAAGQTRLLSVEQMDALLADHGRLPDIAESGEGHRHVTLRTAIGWSHELCSPYERLLWARLSVFPAWFDLEAVVAVCADDRLSSERVNALLSALVDKSIVLVRPTSHGSQFRLLDTVRDYGLGWLRELGEEKQIQRRHLGHYGDVARRFHESWNGPEQIAWVHRIKQKVPNLRVALEFALTEPGERHNALELARHLHHYWIVCAPKEGGYYLDRALAAAPADHVHRAGALNVRAWCAMFLGDGAGAKAAGTASKEVAEQTGDLVSLADANLFFGNHHLLYGDPPQGIPHLLQAMKRYQSCGDPVVRVPPTLCALATISLRAGALDAAVAGYERVRSICADNGEQYVRSHVDYLQAQAELAIGDTRAAAKHARAALRTKVRLGDMVGVVLSIDTLAGTAAATGQLQRAARLFGLAHHIAGRHGIRYRELTAIRTEAEPKVQDMLGAAAYETIFRQGQRFDVDQGIAYALEDKARAKNTTPG
ncbi:ATP-binding protein [Spirillospora sp. NPDC048911]|uniref:ATP-binding protein n=1 Tax=Spirillospora sp. NPDC048911 TaxID=3364527 RepID=UPI00371CC724